MRSLGPEGEDRSAGPSPPILGAFLCGREAAFAFRPGPFARSARAHVSWSSSISHCMPSGLHHHHHARAPSGLIITVS